VINTSTNVVRQLVTVAAGPNGLAIIPDPSAIVTPYVIDAVNDTAAFSIPSSGATAVASVLANDALVARQPLSLTSSCRNNRRPTPGLTGETKSGLYLLVYQICEIANPTNCDRATVRIDLSGGG
jgi:large repetitive protein